jgi:hypothetical protein
MHHLLLVTCAAFPDGDADDRLLIDPLAGSNVDATFAVWDDPDVDWSSAPVVLRSTWDYTLRRERFLRWVEDVPQLHNPAPIVQWNSDKVYLADLERAGLPVTPTVVVPPGARAALPPDHEFVVKPSVGAGSRGAGRFQPTAVAAAHEHVATLHGAGRTALVQPYLDGVDEAGETALVYFAGGFSHAVRKGAMLTADTAHEISATTGLFIEENITARDPSAGELAVGDQVMAYLQDRFGTAPLYARIDLLPGPGGPVVVEAELVEPSLFLSHADGAADRFAAVLASLT